MSIGLPVCPKISENKVKVLFVCACTFERNAPFWHHRSNNKSTGLKVVRWSPYWIYYFKFRNFDSRFVINNPEKLRRNLIIFKPIEDQYNSLNKKMLHLHAMLTASRSHIESAILDFKTVHSFRKYMHIRIIWNLEYFIFIALILYRMSRKFLSIAFM